MFWGHLIELGAERPEGCQILMGGVTKYFVPQERIQEFMHQNIQATTRSEASVYLSFQLSSHLLTLPSARNMAIQFCNGCGDLLPTAKEDQCVQVLEGVFTRRRRRREGTWHLGERYLRVWLRWRRISDGDMKVSIDDT